VEIIMKKVVGLGLALAVVGLSSWFYLVDEKTYDLFASSDKIMGSYRPINVEQKPCHNRVEHGQALFGDLHVHTAYSLDASTQGTRNTPFDAYRFAKGEKLGLQPYNTSGEPQRWAQLDQPLDFAAVTDHAELFGEVKLCVSPSLPGYSSLTCKVYRKWPRVGFFMMNTQAMSGYFEGRFGFCGDDGEACLDAAQGVWAQTQAAADIHNDTSADCEFTAFVAYEWTGAQDVANLHRNVIFSSDEVPEEPITFYEARTAQDLWRGLGDNCDKQAGCDYVVIPHNSNLSNGLMFQSQNPDGSPLTKQDALWRAENERLVEIMQHKGDSECSLLEQQLGLTQPDESCGNEPLPYRSFIGQHVPALELDAPPKGAGFVREVLKEGLAIQQELGANPYKMGIIAASDTHLGTPGYVNEKDFQGHGGAGAPATEGRIKSLPDNIEFNPGGLSGVWAEENTRESIFSAFKRREVFGTSGPRIKVRMFASWDFADKLCEDKNYMSLASSTGVPMGGDLRPTKKDVAPTLLVTALQDPNSEPLQRVQVIKGWVDAAGAEHERVYDVLGSANNGARVDVNSCKTDPGLAGQSFSNSCKVWKDPDFNKDESSFYYTRVLENPSCRWHARVCNANQVQCDIPSTIKPGFEACCDSNYNKVIQERGWSSPIWYTAPTS